MSSVRGILGALLIGTYLLAMMSLDFYWAAIKPQNFAFFVSMFALSWAINKWSE